jgi:predicted SnoaL-like aldol condensation-catalyzing enzyme
MSHHDYKHIVIALLRSIETGDPKPIAYINPGKYIQHNLDAGDGLQGFGELMSHLPPNSAKAKPVRAFQDGDFVFTHTEYDFFGPKIGFDIFRFEDGQIVEHWDNLQPTAPANPSGHTMTDGPTDSKDHDRTEANKGLVRSFMQEVFVNSRTDKRAATTTATITFNTTR